MKRIKITEYEKAMVMYNFSLSMKNIIKLTGYSQNQIARAIGMDKSNFSKMINREKLFTKIDILRIIIFLEIPINVGLDLFDYNGTTIKSNDDEDVKIRSLLFDKRITSIKKLNEALKSIEK